METIRIHTLDDPRLEAFTSLTDSQLRNRLEPEKGIFIAESEKVILRALDAGYEPIAFLMEERWLDGLSDVITGFEASNPDSPGLPDPSDPPDLPIFIGERNLLAKLTGYEVTRGALAAFRRLPLRSVESVCQDARRIAVLEDITNTVNVGSIFRNAAALGLDAVLLTPGCCDPLYRRSLRVSMGNVLNVPWTYIGCETSGKGVHGNVNRLGGWCESGISQLRSAGFKSVALALREDAVSLVDSKLKECSRLAIVLGTEGEGLSDRTIQECDFVACIPMEHGVDSLNVAAASAIAFWELR